MPRFKAWWARPSLGNYSTTRWKRHLQTWYQVPSFVGEWLHSDIDEESQHRHSQKHNGSLIGKKYAGKIHMHFDVCTRQHTLDKVIVKKKQPRHVSDLLHCWQFRFIIFFSWSFFFFNRLFFDGIWVLCGSQQPVNPSTTWKAKKRHPAAKWNDQTYVKTLDAQDQ